MTVIIFIDICCFNFTVECCGIVGRGMCMCIQLLLVCGLLSAFWFSIFIAKGIFGLYAAPRQPKLSDAHSSCNLSQSSDLMYCSRKFPYTSMEGLLFPGNTSLATYLPFVQRKRLWDIGISWNCTKHIRSLYTVVG